MPVVIQGLFETLYCFRLIVFFGQHKFVKSLIIEIRLSRLLLFRFSVIFSSLLSLDKNNSITL